MADIIDSEKEADNIPVVSGKRRFNTNYICSCPGIIRILIVGMGLITIILASIGLPNDLESFNAEVLISSDNKYYGNGYGYIQEDLTVVFFVMLVLIWLVGILMLFGLGCSGNDQIKKFELLNRAVYGLLAIMALIGLVCGSIGTYRFWKGCCNVIPPCGNTENEPNAEDYYRYVQGPYVKYGDDEAWCRCTYLVGEDGTRHEVRFRYQPGDPFNQRIHSATPHDFEVHCFSLVWALGHAVFHFVAVIFA